MSLYNTIRDSIRVTEGIIIVEFPPLDIIYFVSRIKQHLSLSDD